MDISAWIENHAEFDAAKIAIRYERGDLTYGEFAALTRGFARVLKGDHGVVVGDRIAYLGLNSPELLALMFAAARLGAIFTPLNWRLAPPEQLYILKDSAAKVVFVEDDFSALAAAIEGDLPGCEFVALGAGPGPAYSGGGDRNPDAGEDSPFLLVYTSGTTGRPKGALLTQGAVLANALNAVHMHDLTADDHVLTVLPMFHVGGLNIQTLPALHAGATVTLHRRFDPEATLRAITGDKPSLVVLVPATIEALIAEPGWDTADLSSLRAITTGSSIVPVALIEAVRARGVPVIQIYGATETGPVVIYQRIEDGFRKPGASGRPGLLSEARIIGEDGADIAPGRPGEILVRGGILFFEYWGNEEATRAAFRDGWFRTGDIGYADEDGDIFIVGRTGEVIISGGENIYPAEIEAVLAAMDDVAEAAVVGRKDGKWGEVTVAVVVPAPGSAPDPAQILAGFDGVLARFKHPKEVVFVDQLPRNVMGKVLKFEIRKNLEASC